MTPDDDATPAPGRRASRGRRSAAPPARRRRLPEVPRIALPTLPRLGGRDASDDDAPRRGTAARARPADRDDDPAGPDWVPRWVRRIDRRILVTTLVSMLVAAVVGGSIAALGLGLIFVTDACDVDAYVCRDSLFTIGYGIAVAGPLMLTGIAVIVALVGMIRGRTRPWLVLLIGVGASLAAYILGAVIVLVAVPGSSPVT
ncbi:hypothetical protein [Clavibacter michiganensis]|uniref:hypothetical protein n=2 Tax=Clavibacter michiganensis TaxID=28447 RepID=UPI000B8E8B1E|nr:hypothetical protein [Clavibacter michiganensis]AWG00352.1 hypothetical protein BEH62_01915 [Clavibacter michiganensis subsp. insidiosus]OQJ61014.1 hypothetical protein B5P21_14645 [Clavibacter michiganensis subsp. insidiosus]RMC85843.1 hypothetical protein CmiCFBP2404_07005 [Clavibacter michiganensis subsp. insidiosus]